MTLVAEHDELASGELSDSRTQTSVGKALAILDAFEGAATMLGVSEIARRAGLPKSTAFRLLSSLEQQGFVERRDSDYCLGRHLFELGNQVSWCRPSNLRDTALPYLCDLYNLTQKVVHLAVLHGTDVLYLEKLHGHDRLGAPSRVGGRVAARTTALGKAMLAFSEPAIADAAIAVMPTLRTPHTIVLPHMFREELGRVRLDGVAYDREEVRLGLTCVAAPILRRGRPVGAISVSGQTRSFNPSSVAPRVLATAKAIAIRLVA